MECHRGCQLHSRTDPVPKQNELHVLFCFYGLFLWFGFSNFCLIGSGLCSLISLFESVFVCVFSFERKSEGWAERGGKDLGALGRRKNMIKYIT